MNYRIKRFSADEESTLTDARRLRAAVYVETDQLVPEELIGDLDVDKDDDRSIHVGAWAGDDMVGTIRLIMPRMGRPLPIQDDPFGHPVAPGRTSAEISRMVVHAHHRGTGLAQALWREAYWLCVERDITDAYAVVERPFLRILLESGLPFALLGDPKHVYHAPNYPIVCDVPRVILALADQAPAFAYFFAQRPANGMFNPDELRPDPAHVDAFLAALTTYDEATA